MRAAEAQLAQQRAQRRARAATEGAASLSSGSARAPRAPTRAPRARVAPARCTKAPNRSPLAAATAPGATKPRSHERRTSNTRTNKIGQLQRARGCRAAPLVSTRRAPAVGSCSCHALP